MRVFSAAARSFLFVAALALSACSDDDHGSDGEPLTASFSFTGPQSSLDLANYSLAGKYELPISGDPDNRLASEASAVTYDKDRDTLFVVGDGGTAVVQVSKTGELIDSMRLAQDPEKPQGTDFYDTEGIAYVGDGKFVLVEERYRQVDLISYTKDTTFTSAMAQTVKLGTTIGNIGIEGISYDPASGGYVAVKEKDPLGIFQTDIDFAAGTASNGSPATVDSENLFDPAKLGVIDLADVYALSNVLAEDAPDYDQLLVLSQESGKLLKVDREGTVLGTLDLGIPPQTEGVAMDADHALYFANELGGGPGRPQLWVYKPTTSRDAVGVGSRLYVTFSRPVSAGSGNIVISDGAGDTRSIAVDDDEQIRFDGDTLVIDPSDDFLPGRDYSVTVADGALKVDGTALTGVAALVDLDFHTVADEDPPTLVGSDPADEAAGVTSSHLVLTFSEPVKAGSGDVVIRGADGDVRTIAVGDLTQVTITGDKVDINPDADLHPGTAYHLLIDEGAVTDLSGNAYAGIADAGALNFTTAFTAAPTVLNPGELLFMGANADDTDAIAFVLLKAVNPGTQILFTDKNYAGPDAPWPTNEAGLTWTADVGYPAGTIVTIQTDNVLADKGTVGGTGGGISGSGETYYAFQGTMTNPDAGQITVDRFLATINLAGSAAGVIPDTVTTAGAAFTFDENNVRYAGSLDRGDLPAFAAHVKDSANWATDAAAGFPLTAGSLFPEGGEPGTPTELEAGDLLFMAINGDDTDAIAFVLLKDVAAGTQIAFTDKDYAGPGADWPTNEAAFTWTADVAYPAGTIVTVQTDAQLTDKGTLSGAGGGISTSAETYYAFQGTITNASAGQIAVDRFLAVINIGGAAGQIPDALAAAGTTIHFDTDNAKYAGSLDRSDLAAFAALVKNPANWTSRDDESFPLTGGSLFP